ncbi:anthocyanidin 3-O-glucosyltransferase [Striga asiatica]|uniref:Anthocyanidin 3-O-glucosyltransferase n=1 Tax=Striga asiatica TaxID=4170 RepID=A0A5A7PAM4_STRAF|nr:anthocyanidin 3-O-glucosyltransferase [Striga asiatica]
MVFIIRNIGFQFGVQIQTRFPLRSRAIRAFHNPVKSSRPRHRRQIPVTAVTPLEVLDGDVNPPQYCKELLHLLILRLGRRRVRSSAAAAFPGLPRLAVSLAVILPLSLVLKLHFLTATIREKSEVLR